jgi:prolyl oligopeptidase
VKDGFSLPEAKMSLDWRDKDTLFVATDFGAGSLTDSGYARIVKVWKRGTPISAAKTILEGKKPTWLSLRKVRSMAEFNTIWFTVRSLFIPQKIFYLMAINCRSSIFRKNPASPFSAHK